MCDPVTITGAVLSVAGAGLNSAAQSRVNSARNDALQAERIRQSALDQEAGTLATRSQDRYQDFEQKQGEKAKTLGDYFKGQQVDLPPAAAEAPASSSNLTVQNEAKARYDAKARTDQVGGALGNMRAFGDLLGGTSLLQGRDAAQIGQIGGFKKASSNILGQELEEANSAGAALKTLGDIAGGLGKVGVSAGLSGTGGGSLANLFGGGPAANFVKNTAAPYAFGSGGYTGMGPFLNPGKSGLFNLYGG